MKENSIEKDIHLLESYAGMTHKMTDNQGRPKLDQAIEHILQDYKRVLKENEELEEINNELEAEKNEAIRRYNFETIPKQRVKDIIDRIDYDIKKTKEIISKNTNIYASYRKNDYQIVRLKTMNTKSLDIKKRLEELLESEE